jgi:hypothetical protein
MNGHVPGHHNDGSNHKSSILYEKNTLQNVEHYHGLIILIFKITLFKQERRQHREATGSFLEQVKQFLFDLAPKITAKQLDVFRKSCNNDMVLVHEQTLIE